MEICIGEYVRTKDGYIFKILTKENTNYGYCGITDSNTKYTTYTYNKRSFNDIKNKIAKHSKNIIDLLEEGDIVNGFLISKFDNEDGNEFLAIPIFNDAQLDCIEEVRPIATIKIKTILTHEQYMQNCYTVERKK